MAVGGLISRVGLDLAAFRVWELLRATDLRARLRNRRVRALAARELPLPPERLIVLVAGSPDLGWFVEGGKRAMESIRGALERNGAKLEDMQAVLDFGCGCGRVLRHCAGLQGPSLFGCDYNPELIAWSRRNLPFASFAVNDITPPLGWPDDSFDLVWALSVFTHLPEALQQHWLSELRRVLRPGGYILLTTQGAAYEASLSSEERAAFQRGKLVVRAAGAPGTNLCSAFHPEQYIRERLAPGFDLLEFVPEGASGNPHQDQILLRKR